MREYSIKNSYKKKVIKNFYKSTIDLKLSQGWILIKIFNNYVGLIISIFSKTKSKLIFQDMIEEVPK